MSILGTFHLVTVTFFYVVLIIVSSSSLAYGARNSLDGFNADKADASVPFTVYSLYFKNLDVSSRISSNFTSYRPRKDKEKLQVDTFTTENFGFLSAEQASFNAAVLVPIDITFTTLGTAGTEKCSEGPEYISKLIADVVSREDALILRPLYNYSLVLRPYVRTATEIDSTSSTTHHYFCADCIIKAVSRYNSELNCSGMSTKRGAFASGCVTSVLFPENEAIHCEFQQFDSFSSFFLAKHRFVMQPIKKTSDDWSLVAFAAKFNQAKWKRAMSLSPFPLYVIEWRQNLPVIVHVPPKNQENYNITSCFTKSTNSFGAWMPYGGWTLWGRWSENSTDASSSTARRHVVLLIPSTTFNALGNSKGEALSGADSPVSGLVAALAISDAIKSGGYKSPYSITLDLFFLPAEWLGGVGSASLCSMSQQVNASELLRKISDADMVISLDQLALPSSVAPLFYHVDHRVNVSTNAALQDSINSLREQYSFSEESNEDKILIYPASTKKLPFSPVTRYVDYFPEHAKSAVVISFTRYDTGFINPHVFTPSDEAKKTTLDTRSFSQTSSSSPIEEAANVVLRFITDDRALFVNQSVVDTLWNCLTVNWNCSFLSSGANESDDLLVKARGMLPHYPTQTYHPFLSSSEVILSKILKLFGLLESGGILPALPPEFKATSSNATCWRWTMPQEMNPSSTGLVSSGFSILGEVVYSSSSGARVALADPRKSSGFGLLLLGLLVCGVTLYYSMKLV